MRLLSVPCATTALSAILFSHLTHAQTYAICNPLTQSCPADPALGGSKTIDFTSGASSDFTPSGNGVSYNSAGAQLTVSESGDNPTLSSKWYIMFGHVDFVFKAAPGVGMVSSAILISDDLDEIDWELLGADSSQAQTNYFGKGITGSYDRGSFISAPTSQSDFNTYSVDWTSERIQWQLNGVTVRTVYASDAGDQYPQTPMQIKAGSWAGGDSSNAQGTITWAGGPINYADGPFTMQVSSISATDYSTGSAYQYSGTSGSWQEVRALGGSVNSGGGSGSAPPAVTSHHRHTTTPAPSPPPSPSSSPSPSAAPPAAGCKTITEYNQQGFLVTMTVPSGYSKSYNNKGELVKPPPCSAVTGAPVAQGGAAAASPTSVSAPVFTKVPSSANSVGTLATRTRTAVRSGATGSSQTPSPLDPGSDGIRTTVSMGFAMAACAVAALAISM